ncbi:MAG: hypothetical protein HDR13_16020 [Lachnospiraceae bacterium]|nr:hypothetical protein [Lachnospiraceae bacterium]
MTSKQSIHSHLATIEFASVHNSGLLIELYHSGRVEKREYNELISG